MIDPTAPSQFVLPPAPTELRLADPPGPLDVTQTPAGIALQLPPRPHLHLWGRRRLPGAGLLLLGACLIPMAASAQNMNADDLKWINQCIADNKGEPGGTPPIVRAYCVCMNEKMDDNEKQSITQWEKSHPAERKACDKQSGWR